jgi:type II secretion system protein C
MENRLRSFFAAGNSRGTQTQNGRPAVQMAGPRSVRFGVLLCEVAATLALAYAAVKLTHDLMEPEAKLAPVTQVSVVGTRESADLSVLTSFDPFFRAVSGPTTATDSAAPESSLKLELYGMRGDGDGKGTAIISNSGEAGQKLVRVGEDISAGVTLAGVYADRIEISRAGVREAIYLKPKGSRTATTLTAAPQPAPRQVAASSGADLLNSLTKLKLDPVRRDGRLIGFRAGEGADTAMLNTFGLERGDILTGVNGSPLTSFERLKELPDEFASASSLTLEIERNGAPVTHSIRLR